MKAKINAKLGYVYYKCLEKGTDRLLLLKKAKTFYCAMKQAMGTMCTGENEDYQVIERWYIEARQEDMELSAEIAELEAPSQSELERAAHVAAKPIIDEANIRFEQDKSEFKLAFLTWLNENYVPSSHRQPMPDTSVTSNRKKFARWAVGKISKHLHPDKYVNDLKKKVLMEGLSVVTNKVINKLKGHS